MAFQHSTIWRRWGYQNGQCALCGKFLPPDKHDHLWEAHHMVPEKFDGPDLFANCACVCKKCHLERAHDGNFDGERYLKPEYFTLFRDADDFMAFNRRHTALEKLKRAVWISAACKGKNPLE